jgi:N-formylglutamate amidohydrolase
MEGEAAPVIDRSAWWTVHRGASPVLATAIHDGHLVRPELEARLALTAAERLREEDPFTGSLIRDFPNRIACHRSRFEVDLNRSRDEAVYLEPGQAWGLVVWNDPPPADMLARSLRLHDRYYAELRALLRGLEEEHGRLVVLDVHSYNHRRDGPEAPPTDAAAIPKWFGSTCGTPISA